MPEAFGKYQLHEKIAQGGMAEVFLATRPGEIGGFVRRLAIKRVFPHLIDQEEIINMFIDEARIAAQLHHPNIVQIYDLGVVDRCFFIAMEYVEGIDLRRLCELGVKRKNFIPRELGVHIIAEVAAGLHYAHTRHDEDNQPMNIVHRDVSPQNVLISVDGAVKVCDFGIAKAESRLTHTRSGEFKGKFSYMSPEQFGHGTLDKRSDIFTLGIVLYEITVATRLFKARTEYETMRKITEGEVTPPTAIRPDYSPELERIVLKALARDQSERYQSAAELQSDLEEWLFESRARVGHRQLASYLESVWDEEIINAQVKPPAAMNLIEDMEAAEKQAAAPRGLESEEDDWRQTMELSMSEAMVLEEGPATGVVLEDSTLVDGSTLKDVPLEFDEGTDVEGDPTRQVNIPASQLVADAVEIRRITPEEARRRREGRAAAGAAPMDSTEATLVDVRGRDVSTAPLEEHKETDQTAPRVVGANREITGEWTGREDQGHDPEQGDATVDESLEVVESLDVAEVEESPDASDSFLGKLPDLKPGGRELTGVNELRVEKPGVRPTGPMAPLKKPSSPGDGRGALALRSPVVIAAAAGAVIIGGLLVFALFSSTSSSSSSDPEGEVGAQAAGQELSPGTELVGENEVTLQLVTDPPGAFVVVNGLLIHGESPLSVSLVDGRENEVFIGRRYHRPKRLLIAAQGEDLEREVTLERATNTRTARVDFRSTPPGAEVFLNGESIGRTPLRMENVDADFTTHVQFELEGRRPYVAMMQLRTQSTNRIEARLPAQEVERVVGRYNVSPRGSRVNLNGAFLATTPFEHDHHRKEWLSVEVEGHQRQSAQHHLRLDKIGGFELSVALEEEVRRTGRVSIEVEPTAAIYIDSRAFGAGPVSDVELPVGEQTVVLETLEGRRLRVPLQIDGEDHQRYRFKIDGEDVQVERLGG